MRIREVILSLLCFILGTISIGIAHAWSGPSQTAPGGNVSAPVNVGSIDQVKIGGLGINSLAVFGNSLFGGSAGANAYLNFGATSGSGGYGIRDNAGTLEFKNDGGSWATIQSTVQSLTGIVSATATTTFSGGVNVQSGCVAVNGVCAGSGGTGGGASLKAIRSYTSGTNVAYSPAAGTQYIVVEIWGGGGGGGVGGPSGSSYYGGDGGGSGGYAQKLITSLAATYYYTVGAGGAGGSGAGARGATGGTTCLGTGSPACSSAIASATGGIGGYINGASGTTGGTASGGSININGSSGAAGGYAYLVGSPGGVGASAPRGGGGGAPSGAGASGGYAGQVPGGGGGGTGNGAGTAGAGASGAVYIYEYGN